VPDSSSQRADRRARIAAVGFDYATSATERAGACNLCGGDAFAELARRDRYGYEATLRACTRCGLAFLDPRLTPEEYARFYDGVYRPLVSAYHGRTIDARTVQDDQSGYAAELVGFLGAALPSPPGSIMDIGGSTGVVAGVCARTFGCRATVLDPAPAELEVAAAAGLDTVAGFAEDFDPGERRWDLVLLCQTIDHLLNIASTLRSIRGMLAPHGSLFVDVVDIGWVMRRKAAVEEATKVDHPYYLTRHTARAYLELTGFEVRAERLSDDGHWGFLAAPAEPVEPDWAALSASADAFLDEAWALRARSD